MQDAVVATKSLDAEAKLTNGASAAAASPTIKAQGVLDVHAARDVYLNLDAADVASLIRQGADLVLTNISGEVLRLEGFFQGQGVRKLFLEDDRDRVHLVDTAQMLVDGPVSLSLSPAMELSPFESLTSSAFIPVGPVVGGGLGASGAVLGGLVALGGLAGLAAGGGGGGGDNDGPSRVFNPPTDTVAPDAATGLTFSANGAQLGGSGEAGAAVTVRNAAGTVVGTGTVAADNTFTVSLNPPLTDGQAVSVTLRDTAGNVSPSATGQAPDITAPASASNVDVSDSGAAVTGAGQSGVMVTVTGQGGAVLGTGVVAPDGTFTIPLSPPLMNGEIVSVVLTDPAGNPSLPVAAVAPDTTAPSAPADLVFDTNGGSLTGSGEPGAAVTVTGATGEVLGTAAVAPDG